MDPGQNPAQGAKANPGFAHEATQALQLARDGDEAASQRVVELVYDELHHVAQRLIAGERADHSLQATGLLHEVWMKLQSADLAKVEDRHHFIRLASRAMRNLLVDHARGKARLKRGYGWDRVTWSGEWVSDEEQGVDVEGLHEALTKLAALHARAAEIIEMRFFGGFTAEEAAEVLGISKRTLEREWRFARAWLFDALQ